MDALTVLVVSRRAWLTTRRAERVTDAGVMTSLTLAQVPCRLSVTSAAASSAALPAAASASTALPGSSCMSRRDVF